jgi:hypothetical protein
MFSWIVDHAADETPDPSNPKGMVLDRRDVSATDALTARTFFAQP